MEGKGVRAPLSVVIMVVVVLGLVVAQTQVEAKSCCDTTTARNCYNLCRVPGTPRPTCASLCGCIIVPGETCPRRDINFFCKLGCASSMCSTITTLQNSDLGEEAMKEAVEPCNNACSENCNKGSYAVVTA